MNKRLIKGLVLIVVLSLSISMTVISTVSVGAYYIPNENEFISKLNNLRNTYGSRYSGNYYENGSLKAGQCHGYANQLAHDIFGSTPYTGNGGWQKSWSMGTIYAGDIVRIYLGSYEHTIFVTKVSGDNIYFTDANYDWNNGIRWDQCYSIQTLAGKFIYKQHLSGNTLTGNGNRLPDKTTVSFSAGTNNTATQFWWDNIKNATSYDVKIWKGELWKGDPYKILWDVKDTWCEVDLPSGYYEAYVDTRNENGINMSNNVVKFSVPNIYMPEKTYVACTPGTNLKKTCIWWDKTNYTDFYDVKIWKGELWKGDPYKVLWTVTDTWCEVDLPSGYYEAYIDSRNDNGISMSNNVIKFTVDEEKPNIYYSINSRTGEVDLSWDEITDVNIYDLKIWENKVWEGDPVKIIWDLTDTHYTIKLPVGNYEAYVDYRYNNTLNMSKVVNFTVENSLFLGDINGDSKVTIDDVTLIQKYLANMSELDSTQLKVADVNDDRDISIDDVTMIQKYLAGIITSFS